MHDFQNNFGDWKGSLATVTQSIKLECLHLCSFNCHTKEHPDDSLLSCEQKKDRFDMQKLLHPKSAPVLFTAYERIWYLYSRHKILSHSYLTNKEKKSTSETQPFTKQRHDLRQWCMNLCT